MKNGNDVLSTEGADEYAMFSVVVSTRQKKKVTSMIHLAEGFRAKKNYAFGIQFRSKIGHVLPKKESIWSTSLHMENDIVVFRILGTSKNFQKITSNSIPKVYQNHLKYRENK